MKNALRVLQIACVVICIFCIYKLFGIYNTYHKGTDVYQKIEKQTINDEKEPEKGIFIDFDKLNSINEDVVGWIYSKDTVINYPVVQGDNNRYYLKHLIDHTSNACGSIFMDYRNTSDLTDRNTLIYGHHMKNGSMFQSLTKYRSQKYYDKHPIIYYATSDCTYQIAVFSGYVTDTSARSYKTHFQSKKQYTDFLNWIKKQSDFVSSVPVSNKDRIVTLSTCSYEYENARYVIHGKLIPITKQ